MSIRFNKVFGFAVMTDITDKNSILTNEDNIRGYVISGSGQVLTLSNNFSDWPMTGTNLRS